MRGIVSTIYNDMCKKCTLAKNMVKQKDDKKTMDGGYIGQRCNVENFENQTN